MHKYQKACKKKANIIRNFIYQSVSDIIKHNPKAIVIEGFNVERLKRDHYMAKQIYDCNFGKIREIIKEKCEQYNIPLIVADECYPSSQICSICGARSFKLINYHIYHCNCCDNEMDRDLNAARNLASLADNYDYSFEIIA